MLALGLEETLDLPAADADAGHVAKDVGRALVGQVGAQVEDLLAHGRGVLGALREPDPLVEWPPHRAARRTAVARAADRERAEHGHDPPHGPAAAPHRHLAAGAEDRLGDEGLLHLDERRPERAQQCLARLAAHLALQVVERRRLKIQVQAERDLDRDDNGGRHDRRRLREQRPCRRY